MEKLECSTNVILHTHTTVKMLLNSVVDLITEIDCDLHPFFPFDLAACLLFFTQPLLPCFWRSLAIFRAAYEKRSPLRPLAISTLPSTLVIAF
jgi:hypothetical protein